jgi:hypothetical protein
MVDRLAPVPGRQVTDAAPAPARQWLRWLCDTWGQFGSASSISFEVEEAVVLAVLGVVEQRHAAVLEALVDGAPVSEVTARADRTTARG